MRAYWPRGFFGWLGYLLDHRLHGYQRPVDWTSVWALEHSGYGLMVCAGDAVLPLLGDEVDVFRLVAAGLGDPEIATLMHLAEPRIRALRRKIVDQLGVSQQAELAAIAATHGLNVQSLRAAAG